MRKIDLEKMGPRKDVFREKRPSPDHSPDKEALLEKIAYCIFFASKNHTHSRIAIKFDQFLGRSLRNSIYPTWVSPEPFDYEKIQDGFFSLGHSKKYNFAELLMGIAKK